MDKSKLKAIAFEHGYTYSTLATSIGINKSTFYRKLNEDGERFSVKEIKAIAEKLSLTKEDVFNIFFKIVVA